MNHTMFSCKIQHPSYWPSYTPVGVRSYSESLTSSAGVPCADFHSLHFQISADGGQPSRQAASGGRMNPCHGTLRASELIEGVTQPAQSLAGLLALSWARKTIGHEDQPVARWISRANVR